MFLQARAKIRQEPAQISGFSVAGLAYTAPKCSVDHATGEPIPAFFANYPIPTPSFEGQVDVSHVNVPVFLFAIKVLPGRRGFAQSRFSGGFGLRNGWRAGFVPPIRKSKNKGLAGCDQQDLSPYWRYARAWRPVAKPSVNRRYTVPGQACSALSSLMAIRSLVPSPVRQATCCTARQGQATAAELKTGLRTGPSKATIQNTRSRLGLTTHTQRAVAGHPVCSGVLCLQHPQSKDTPCSTRS
jgi:hypothetical protein